MSSQESSQSGNQTNANVHLAPHPTSPIKKYTFNELDTFILGINNRLGIKRRDGRRAISKMPDDDMSLAVTRFRGPSNLRILTVLSLFEDDLVLDMTARTNVGPETAEDRIAAQAVLHRGKTSYTCEDISDEVLRSYTLLVTRQLVSGVFVPENIHGPEFLPQR